jgi:hypothetical protein
MATTPPIRIWIVRRGNGRVQATPSPVHLHPDESFSIRNLARDEATVAFPAGTIDLKQPTVPAGGTVEGRVVVRPPAFFEYDVTLARSGEYAEGGSKPGVIVDG